MNKKLMVIAVTSALVGTLCNVNLASAQESRIQKTNDPEEMTDPSSNAIGGADAPSVRLAGLIKVNINRSVSVFRSKGIAGVTSPEVGLVCIQPSSTLNVSQIVPVTSIDFSKSAVLGHNFVEYRSAGVGCPAGNIAVKTFVLDPNVNKRPDDGVAFTIVVP
jgi:hypothetical protein